MQRVIRAAVGVVTAAGVFCLGGATALTGAPGALTTPLSALVEAVPRMSANGVGQPTPDGSGAAWVTVARNDAASGVSAPWLTTGPGGGPGGAPGAAGALGIPTLVFDAYQKAASTWSQRQPACNIRWQILAGIGKVESSHARGGQVTAAGDTQPRIFGPTLQGQPGVAAISDTDGGRWDGDGGWDRAVGLMQFIPGTWKAFGVDGTGDGVADPHNIYDATLSAAHYLCYGGADLSTDAGLNAALRRYNNSLAYVLQVRAWIKAYDDGRGHSVAAAGPGPDLYEPPASAAGDRRPTSDEPGSNDDGRAPDGDGPGSDDGDSDVPPDPTGTPEPTEKPEPTGEPDPTKTPQPTQTPDPTPTKTPTPTPTKTPTPTPTKTPTPTPTPTKTPTPTPTPTQTPEPTEPPEPTGTPEPTETPQEPECPEESETPSPTDSETPEPTSSSGTEESAEDADPDECAQPSGTAVPGKSLNSPESDDSPEGATATETPGWSRRDEVDG